MKSHSQLAELGRYWMLLVFWVVIAVAAAPAQQPDAPSAAKAGASEQPDVAANAADPPDETTEAMFPHFKDTRFWLTGQANFISRLILRSTLPTVARTASAPITKKPRRV